MVAKAQVLAVVGRADGFEMRFHIWGDVDEVYPGRWVKEQSEPD